MKHLILAGLLAFPSAAGAHEPRSPDGLTVDRVVMLMRHGVRPPTKAPAMPDGVAAEEWPAWPVKPGHLTPHGAEAIRRLARYDGATWRAAGLLRRAGCRRVRVVADSDQRTIATGKAWAEALSPACRPAVEHKPQDVADPLFAPLDRAATRYDADRARAAVLAAAGPGGIAAAERRLRPVLTRLDAILCGRAAGACGVAGEPTALAPAAQGKRPKLSGAIDRGSTAAQILLLEYADGKPMAEVGWGRAGAADIAATSALHSMEFALLARPHYVARANLALLAPLIGEALDNPHAAAVTVIVGHDTNVASLGGLLGLHWRVPGLAEDDPSPGGAIMFERLRGRGGARYVRAIYRSQTVEQVRALTPLGASAPPYRVVMPIAGCRALGVAGLCTAQQFAAMLTLA